MANTNFIDTKFKRKGSGFLDNLYLLEQTDIQDCRKVYLMMCERIQYF